MQITATAQITQRQHDRIVSKILPKTEDPITKQPFPTLEAYCSFVLDAALTGWNKEAKETEIHTVADRYDAAAPEVQAQIDALLG